MFSFVKWYDQDKELHEIYFLLQLRGLTSVIKIQILLIFIKNNVTRPLSIKSSLLTKPQYIKIIFNCNNGLLMFRRAP